MSTPVREAHDNRPRADAGCRRPSEVSCASSAGALSPRDHLFSVFLWNAWERASNRSGGTGPRVVAARRQPAACGPWEQHAARRLGASWGRYWGLLQATVLVGLAGAFEQKPTVLHWAPPSRPSD